MSKWSTCFLDIKDVIPEDRIPFIGVLQRDYIDSKLLLEQFKHLEF